MTTRTISYLSGFGDIGKLPRQRLLDEMDNVWVELKLDNTIPLSIQSDAVGRFYCHPVWALNGVFSELDLDSKKHRIAIADYIKLIGASRVADYGGGSGVLARFISEVSPACVDIIEPYPFQIFADRLKGFSSVQFVPVLDQGYDVVVAQDVLEHVDNPLELAVQLISSTRMGGHLIFANCFYPDIKCHLPATFYLRHTFPSLMSYVGLKLVGRVGGAEHALVFKRIGPFQRDAFDSAAKRAKIFGTVLNRIVSFARKSKQFVKNMR